MIQPAWEKSNRLFPAGFFYCLKNTLLGTVYVERRDEMGVDKREFIERFQLTEIKGAEIRLLDSQDYYIVQKHGDKTDLYVDREAEYPEDPAPERKAEVINQSGPVGGATEFGGVRGFFSVRRYPQRKEAELVKHLRDIEDIGKYIEFKKVCEIIYEKS